MGSQMNLYSCAYDLDAHPWSPEEVMAAAKEEVRKAGGTITKESDKAYQFLYECKVVAINTNRVTFRNKVDVVKLEREEDQKTFKAKATKPKGAD